MSRDPKELLISFVENGDRLGPLWKEFCGISVSIVEASLVTLFSEPLNAVLTSLTDREVLWEGDRERPKGDELRKGRGELRELGLGWLGPS